MIKMKKLISVIAALIIFASFASLAYAADLTRVYSVGNYPDDIVSNGEIYLSLKQVSTSSKDNSRILRSTDLENWESIDLPCYARDLYKNGNRFLVSAYVPNSGSSLDVDFYESIDGYNWSKLGSIYGKIGYVCNDTNDVGVCLFEDGKYKNMVTDDFVNYREGFMTGNSVINGKDTLRYYSNGHIVIRDYDTGTEYPLVFISVWEKDVSAYVKIYQANEFIIVFDLKDKKIYTSSDMYNWHTLPLEGNLSDSRIFTYNGSVYLCQPGWDSKSSESDNAYIIHKRLTPDGSSFENVDAFSFLDQYMIEPKISPAGYINRNMFDYEIIKDGKIYFRISHFKDYNGWIIADDENHGTYHKFSEYDFSDIKRVCFDLNFNHQSFPELGYIYMDMPTQPLMQMMMYHRSVYFKDCNGNLLFEKEMPGAVYDVEYKNGYYYCRYKEKEYPYNDVYAMSKDRENWDIIDVKAISGNASIMMNNNGAIGKITSGNSSVDVLYENNNYSDIFPNTLYNINENRDMIAGDKYLYKAQDKKLLFSTDGIYYTEFTSDNILPDKLTVFENDNYYIFSKANNDVVELTNSEQPYYYIIQKDKFREKLNVLQNGQTPYVIYNDTILAFEQPPVIENDRTLIPIRFLFEQMGATVDWNGDTQTATISQDNTAVSFSINDIEADVNGQTVSMDVPAQLINGKTMVPVRFLSEELGYDVDWDGENRIITIE